MQSLATTIKTLRAHGIFFGGYALYMVFSYMAFHSLTMLEAAGTLGIDIKSLFPLGAMAGRTLVLLAFAAGLWRLRARTSSIPVILTISAATLGFVITAMVIQFSTTVTLAALLPWFIVGAVALGAVDGAITLLWAHFSATLSMRMVYLFVLLSNAMGLALYTAATLLPPPLMMPLAALLLLASAASAKSAIDKRSGIAWEFSRPLFRGVWRNLWHPLLGTMILSFMGGLMMQITGQQEVPLEHTQLISVTSSAIVIACLLIPLAVVRKPLNLGRLYAVALPLTAAGFLLLPLVWDSGGGIVNAFAQLGAMVAAIILWCMTADAAHQTRLPPVLLFSTTLLCINAAQLLGALIGYYNAPSFRHSDILLTAVALVSLYLLLLLALLASKGRDTMPDPHQTADPAPADSLQARCNQLAAQNNFTPREAEVFLLLAQGYTLPAISAKLYVSENTAKSHAKNIYQKLNVHSRTELLNLVGS
jgi:DNA-binding CsgD family transcriptional regulator